MDERGSYRTNGRGGQRKTEEEIERERKIKKERGWEWKKKHERSRNNKEYGQKKARM